MTCDEIQSLMLEFAEGELDDPQSDAVRTHVRACGPCMAKLRSTRELVGDLSAARSLDHQVNQSSPPPPTAAESLLGRRKIGDFEILGELGRGGMGVVYRARQISLNRVVALKVLNAGTIQSERHVTRFRKEARAAARLHHTNIVPVYAQGEEDGLFYYAMELIDGRSLSQVLQENSSLVMSPEAVMDAGQPSPAASTSPRAAASAPAAADPPPGLATQTHAARGPASLPTAFSITVKKPAPQRSLLHSGVRHRDYKRIARLFAEVADGLQHAHEQGIVHRDIKPQNLMLGRDDRLHITDFGLARLLDEPGMTLSTELVGTPAYMSPEQVSGDRQRVGPRSDIYSLGVSLYEVLALQRPHQAETYDQMIHHVLHRDPPPPRKIDPHVPLDLETICLRAIEKEPARRFAAAADMARELRRYADDTPLTIRRTGPLGKLVRWVRRNPARATAGAAVVAVLLLGVLTQNLLKAYVLRELSAAWDALMEDYRNDEPARAHLASIRWLNPLFGDSRRFLMADALANALHDAARAHASIEQHLLKSPADADAHCLAAWICVRLMRDMGDQKWADARAHLARAEQHVADLTHAGHFFRGMALVQFDPETAAGAFGDAVKIKGAGFLQAMMQQARASNYFMYMLRDRGIKVYGRTADDLGYIVRLQPQRELPRYLLATCHIIAAEIYRDDGKPEQADECYRLSLAVWDDPAVESIPPENRFNVIARAHESRGDLAKAIQVLESTPESVLKNTSRREEWAAYLMRLYYWTGNYAKAAECCRIRFEKVKKYDPDAALFAALIAHAASDDDAARQALDAGVQASERNAEHLLLLDAGYRLVGLPPPDGLLSDEKDFNSPASPRWSSDWLKLLYRYQRGETAWDEVIRVADELSGGSEVWRHLLMAGAHFYRAAATNDAATRREALRAAWKQHDNERYAFRAKMVLGPEP
ncbi:Serine/threonine-protein kinase PrkC [Phycisphaerae bacterium RAS1]|nr:Serine/threonine-protein kinase PrkC [Phycisphaerae bacterium RAS1]